VLGRREIRRGFWCGKLEEGDNLEDLCIDGLIILNGSTYHPKAAI
jgi:hypothetical protein